MNSAGVPVEESVEAIRAAARTKGMRSLHEEGEKLVAVGLCTPAEIERVVQGAL